MSKRLIIVLMSYRHKLLDLINKFSLILFTSSEMIIIF
jgi:hypothetical protein